MLTRNPNAVQIGLTATPRELEITERSKEAQADLQITADNLKHFGEPVYEYDMAQGIEDGYLAACEIHRIDLFLDDKPETEGVEREDLKGKTLTDANTGELLSVAKARERYGATDLEDKLLLPERVVAINTGSVSRGSGNHGSKREHYLIEAALLLSQTNALSGTAWPWTRGSTIAKWEKGLAYSSVPRKAEANIFKLGEI